MWLARNKTDLMIEVWEKLDCESVGRVELEAIGSVVEAEYGSAAVDSPMVVARLLADEGAVIRHAEIMEFFLERESARSYDAVLNGLLDTGTLASTLRSMTDLERVRSRYFVEGNRAAIEAVRDLAIREKQDLMQRIQDPRTDAAERQLSIEITEWLSHWLQTPKIFADWVAIRQKTADFIEKFGHMPPVE